MTTFIDKLNGSLTGLMRWKDWDTLRERVASDSNRKWFAYAVGREAPTHPLDVTALRLLLDEIDALLRRDHEESYLGIVYVDDIESPCLIKIYDPNNLGATCGSSGRKVMPGWVLSTDVPQSLEPDAPIPGNRRRWWDSVLERLLPQVSS